jgi:hypothetical protein
MLYPLSLVPAAIAYRWLKHYDIMPWGGPIEHGLIAFYQPAAWLLFGKSPQVTASILDAINKLSP